MVSAKTKRMLYVIGVALLAASQLPIVGEMLSSLVSREYFGLSVLNFVAAGVLYGTYLLYKKQLG